jgi:hypothetical protein
MPISFESAGSFGGNLGGGVNLQNPTSLQFGPDGRLYVSEQNGDINAFTVEKQGDTWGVTDAEVLTLSGGGGVVKSIQNHNDDGTESNTSNRQVTGIVVTEDDQGNIVLYISSSDPRIATNNDSGLDTNSGVVTKVTQTDTGWEAVDLVRGLPRSEENHSVNGMVLSPDGTKLLLQVGGFTNNGAPSGFFSYTNEYVLSGTVLELDLVALDALPDQIDPEGGQGNTPRAYKYDLPTLDDPNIENAPDTLTDAQAIAQGFRENSQGMDLDGPHGGNDGLNMAILPSDAPLRLYADGLRNAYDLAQGANGLIYTVDNGSNGNLGAEPNTENGDDDGDGIANEAIATPNNGGQGEGEPFHQIVEGGYYYHPAPVRSNQNMAWTVYGNNAQPDPNVSTNFVPDISALVPAQLINDGVMTPGFLIDPTKFAVAPGVTLADLSPQEQAERLALSGIWINSNQLDNDNFPDPDGDGPGQKTIAQLGSSTNGIIVYDSGGAAFGGSIDGAVFVTQFNDNLTLLNVNDAGTDLEPIFAEGPDGIFGTADDVLQDADGILQVANNSLGVPLGNPLDVTQGPNGTLWVAEIGSNEITVLEPTVVLDPANEDADFDGILNKDDPFSRDATNGTSVTVTAAAPTVWEFSQGAGDTTPGPDGFGGGLTGAMINGETDFEAFYLEEDPNGNNPGDLRLDNVKFVTAALGGTTTIEQVSNGDPLGTTNDGEFLFHTGFILDQAVETFTVSWNVANPAAITGGSDITSPEQQIGGYLGDGTQSNYLKIVAVQTNDGPKIRLVLEESVNTGSQFDPNFVDTVIQTLELDASGLFDDTNLVTDSFIKLDLLVDLNAKTATPQATFDTTSGPVTITGGPSDVIDLAPSGQDSKVLTTFLGGAEIALGEQQGIAAGLFSSNTGSTNDSFQAVFDSITVSATEAEVAPIAVDDDVTAQINTAIQIPVATLLANDTDANSGEVLTITAVANAVNGTVALNDGVVTFTPAQDFQGDATFDYTVEDSAGLIDTGSVTVTVANEVILYRINAGGNVGGPGAGTIAAIDGGPDWVNDATLINGTGPVSLTGATSNTFSNALTDAENEVDFLNGENAADSAIAPWQLFVNERSDNTNDDTKLTYNFNVTPGETYKISLFYTENWNNIFGFASGTTGGKPAGQSRQFDVEVEGIVPTEFNDINPLAESDALVDGTPPSANSAADNEKQPFLGVALQRDYIVTAGDDTLNIAFNHEFENPKVNAIQIAQVGGAVDPVDPVPVLNIVSGTQTVTEGDTAFISIATDITVPNDEVVTFTYEIEGVTATPEVDYSPDDSLNGAGTATFTGNATITGGSSDFQIPIDTLPDDLVEGAETFTVTITSVSPNATLGANSVATVTIADDDVATGGGEVVVAINAGGPALTQDGIDFAADQFFDNGDTFADGNAGNGQQPVFDGTVFETERFGGVNNGTMSYSIPVPNGDYTVELYFAEIFQPNGGGSGIGARVFDVTVEGQTVLDDFDILQQTSGDINQPVVFTVPGVFSPDGGGDDPTTIDINFSASTDNAKISAIVIRDANGNVYEPPLDDLFGTAVEIADTGDAPSGPVALTAGSNVMSATQEGEGDGANGVRDRDYFTVEVPDGFQLTGVVLNGYDNTNAAAPDGFLAFQQGDEVTVDPTTGANVDDLQGAIIYGANDLSSNLLETMRGGFSDPQTGLTLPGFDQPLTGTWTFWLNQGAGPSTATLDFIVEPLPASAVTLAIADAPTLVENGDVDPTTLNFAIAASDSTFSGEVTITYDQGDQTGLTAPVTFTDGVGTLSIAVPSDDVDDGDDIVSVTLTSVDDGTTVLTIDTAAGSATGIITEDDVVGTPDDIDGDGILNTDDPFAYDGQNGLSRVLTPGAEFQQDFNVDTDDPFSAEGGFTGILVNPAFNYPGASEADPYGDRTSGAPGVTIAGGTLNVLSRELDAFPLTGTGADNTLADGYQSAVDVAGIDRFEVHARASSADWLGKTTTTAGFEQFGITLGAGGVDDFVKLVLSDNNNNNNQPQRVQIAHNNSLIGGEQNFEWGADGPTVDLTLVGDVEFRLIVDKTAGANGQIVGQVDFFAAADGTLLGSFVTPALNIDPAGSLAVTLNGQNPLTGGTGGLAYGVFVSDWSAGAANRITANYDFLTVRGLNLAPEASAIDVGAVDETAEPVSINLLQGVTDPDGGTLAIQPDSVSAVDGVGNPVTFILDGTSLSIDPAQFAAALDAGQSETVTVSYTIIDGQGGEAVNTATLVVNGVDDVPVPALVLGNAPSKVETGDNGVTTLVFPVSTDASVSGDVTVTYQVNGETPPLTATVNLVAGVGALLVDVANDNEDTNENIDVALISTTTAGLAVDNTPATGRVIEDDTPIGQLDSIGVDENVVVGEPGNPYVLADDVTEVDTSASASDTNLVGNSLDNTFTVGTGDDSIDLQADGGADTIIGTPAALDGTAVTNFQADDEIVIVDENGAAQTSAVIVNVQPSSTVVTIDPDGNLTDNSDQFSVTLTEDDLQTTLENGVLTVAAAPAAAPIRFQAEDFDASVGYGVQTQNAAEGNEVAFLPSGGASGSATYDLAARGVAPGVYNLTIGHFDENDGESNVTVTIDGVAIGSFTFDDDATSGNAAQASSFRTETFANVTVGENGQLVVAGTTDAGEFARLDWIEFVPVTDGSGAQDNTAPFAPFGLADQSVTEATGFAFDAGAFFADNEEDALTYTVVTTTVDGALEGNLPVGVSFDPATGIFGGAPTVAGSYQITVTANDGEFDSNPVSFALAVTEVNEAPVVDQEIANQTVEQGEALTLDVTGNFSDPDVGDELAYTVVVIGPAGTADLPAGITFADGIFGGTVTNDAAPGSYLVTVTVSDGEEDVSDSFLINVTGAVGDDRDTVRIEAEDFELVSGFFEEAGSRIRLLANSEGEATYALNQLDGLSGHYDVSVTFFDESDGVSSATLLYDADGSGNFVELGSWNFDQGGGGNAAQAQNLRTLTFSGLTVSENGVLKFMGQSNAGEFLRTDYFELIPVGGDVPNFAPTEAGGGIPDITVQGLDAIDLDASTAFSDSEDDPLTYAKVAGPDWVTIDPVSGAIIGKPPAAGEYEITVSATDANNPNLPATSTFTLTVEVPDNAPPTLTLTPVLAEISEDADVTASTKVADITVTDDGIGTNNLALTGDDAALFEIVDNSGAQELHLAAGVDLDFAANPSLDVSVTVDDPELGTGIEDSAAVSVAVTDVDEPVGEEIVLRINAFGPQVEAIDGGPVWLADGNGTNAGTGISYLSTTDSRGDAFDGYDGDPALIPVGVPEAVLDTARSSNDPFSYDIPVGDIGGPGTFRVNLYIAELFTGGQAGGFRIFDASLEGAVPVAFDNIDPGTDFGPGGNLGVLSAEISVDAGDGVLNIGLLQDAIDGAQNPIVNAIEVVRIGDPAPDNEGPIASIALTNPADANAPLTVAVTLTDATGVDPASLGADDLLVTGNTGAVTFNGFAAGVATYSVAAPADGWLDDGTVDVTLEAGAIADTLGNLSTEASQSITLDIGDSTGGTGDVLLRINAFGPELAASGDGPTWLSDLAGDADDNALFTFTGVQDRGDIDPTPATPGLDGVPDALFATARSDDNPFAYNIPVSTLNGVETGDVVTVNLYFAEAFDGNNVPGERIFDVTTEGVIAIDDLDVAAQFSGSGGVISTVVQITGDTLNLDFVGNVDNAIVNGIEIVAGGSDPINSGGTIDPPADPSDAIAILQAAQGVDLDNEGGSSGSVELRITENSNNVTSSNFGSNSFQIENTGDKDVAAVFVDFRNALYGDSVVDFDGSAGDVAAKKFATNSETGGDGDTGSFFGGDSSVYFLPGEDPLPNNTGTGNASTGGWRGVLFKFDTDGEFETGEVFGTSGDMDPNSIAGLEKGGPNGVDNGAINGWDVGGVSGAELIGSSFTVMFDDGTFATGFLGGAGNQAGSIGEAVQGQAVKAATVTVNGVGSSQAGTYGGTIPEIIVSGDAGDTVRVTLSRGINPVTNNTNGVAELVANRLADAHLAFPVNNAADFQFFDITIGADGTATLPSNAFNWLSPNSGGQNFNGFSTAPAVVGAAVIDPVTDMPLGSTDRVYLTNQGGPVSGGPVDPPVDPPSPTGQVFLAENGKVVFEAENTDLSQTPGWIFETVPEGANENPDPQGDGYIIWEGGNSFGSPANNSTLSYTFLTDENGNYVVKGNFGRRNEPDTTEANDLFIRMIDEEGNPLNPVPQTSGSNTELHVVTGEVIETPTSGFDPNNAPGGSRVILNNAQKWMKFYISGVGLNELDGGGSNGDNGPINVVYNLEANTQYTLQIAGRSNDFEVDRLALSNDGAGDATSLAENGAQSQIQGSFGPTVPTVVDPIDDVQLVFGNGTTIAAADAFQDLDGDTLDFMADFGSIPDGQASIDSNSGEITLFSEIDLGDYTVEVTATDDDGNSATDTFDVDVVDQLTGGTVSVSVASATDDWEQFGFDGGATSGDFELGFNAGQQQWAALRFTGIDIPDGATVTDAAIRFTAQGSSTGAASFNIALQNSENAAPFSTANLPTASGRNYSQNLAWDSIPAWTDGQTYDTPDLASLVNGVIGNNGVNDGALAFFFQGSAGSRVADAFETSGGVPANLLITYDFV